jgi:hypothetical protein
MLGGGSKLSEVGSRFRFKTLGFFFEPEVVRFEQNRQLLWSAKGPFGTSGSHAWYIEGTATGCRVVTEEAQVGWLLYLMKSRARGQLLVVHQEWLEALKRRAEIV